MKNVCVVTSTRADYGLLKPLIHRLYHDDELNLRLVVTGTHLSAEFGMSLSEITGDHYPIDAQIDILNDLPTENITSNIIANVYSKFPRYFMKSKLDLVVLLGDRFEIFAVAGVCVNLRIPIAHMFGGETTQGATDESYRHCITKMSYLHFASTALYRKRIIQMGENPSRVFNTGDTCIENIMNIKKISINELEDFLKFKLSDKPFGVVTFHPVTLENATETSQIKELFRALDKFTDMNFILTKSNADEGGSIINRAIDDYANSRTNIVAVASLGMVRYISALSYAAMVIGNSSSGITEAPAMKIPTVNIGDRQKGRIQTAGIINCEPNYVEIIRAIEKARSFEFKRIALNAVNPYGDGTASLQMMQIMKEFLLRDKINLKKKFYDIKFEV